MNCTKHPRNGQQRESTLQERATEKQATFFRTANKLFREWSADQKVNIWNRQTFSKFQRALFRAYEDVLRLQGCTADELRKLKLAAHRETLAKHVGKPNGVQVATRQLASDRLAWANDLYGTLVAIRRTRCVVHFGEKHGQWTFPLDMIIPWDMAQAWILGASMERPIEAARAISEDEVHHG